jgi:hypothetical protein
VWGAALDAEIGTRAEGAKPVLLREMAAPFSPDTFYRRSALWAMARAGIDERMAQAYVSPDSAPVRLDAAALGRRTRVRIAGVIGADAPADGGPPQADGQPAPVVSVGRVAYDAHRRRALVNVWWTCGSLCGHGSLMLLEKDAGGQWRQAAVVMSFRS